MNSPSLPPYPITSVPESRPTGGGGIGVFDSQDALAINRARLEHLESLPLSLTGRSVLDVGCGVGHLGHFLAERGCRVTCVDGREENISALSTRYPELQGHVANVETDSLEQFGRFDIVFCYGLLYHLENPVAGIRNMANVCKDLLLLETVVVDHSEPLMRLEDEPADTVNQAVRGLGCRPSPAFVAMSLNRVGFPYVYAPKIPPQHPDFRFEWKNNLQSSREGHLLRCIFVASRTPLNSPDLALLVTNQGLGNVAEVLERARSLIYLRPLGRYPGWTFGADWDNPDPAFRERRGIWEYFRDRQLQVPLLFGWYSDLRLNLYLGNDLSRQLFIAGCAEPNELAFLDQVLTSNMVFIDGGANDGLYTLFASRRVGSEGAVWSFEPSTREFQRLAANVKLNDLSNVRLFQFALAERDGDANLRIAAYEHEGQNTLGEFVHDGVFLERTERVVLRTLDSLVAQEKLARVDVIKLDVEGAEFRVLSGARNVLRNFRPILLFEAVQSALQKQGGSIDQIRELLESHQYGLYAFDADGVPALAPRDLDTLNMVAVPAENPLADKLQSQPYRRPPNQAERPASHFEEFSPSSQFSPAYAYWKQRLALANARDRIRDLSNAVDHAFDLLPYQWAQLMAVIMDYEPDLVIELGRGYGNSTCAFTEASNQRQQRTRVLSLCASDDWQRITVPRLRNVVEPEWFEPLEALRADILDFDYERAIAGKRRVVIFWDAHGFEIAECVLGVILPAVANREHLVIMHDLSDTRYSSEEQLEYGEQGLWKGNNWSGPRLKLGFIDTAVEQAVSVLDFATRNHLTFDSADHSFRTELTAAQQSEMKSCLGELFDTQGHWFYFSLNEKPGPYKFPRFTPPRPVTPKKKRWYAR